MCKLCMVLLSMCVEQKYFFLLLFLLCIQWDLFRGAAILVLPQSIKGRESLARDVTDTVATHVHLVHHVTDDRPRLTKAK